MPVELLGRVDRRLDVRELAPPPRRSARHAARSAEQTDIDIGSGQGNAQPDTSNAAAEPQDTGKKRKAPASAADKGYEKKTKKRRG
ncbi:hypothetical protein CYLTODRAFT_458412 [Cylindrobasidium torrendii FP15055 ss-10]|uniref:Uncharacterized protein n=1 Tax=Cylindrobasidium torrendii FP15055 ss-10 TaxID=1314674 RepID=A0A0D7AXI5_9AGAR|nr:hypothetical protein CYLTODRAFT_458412 [Cylindrobasidium torrendii FP15055 ss-10]